MPEYLILLACGHGWPGTAADDAEAAQILGLFEATQDSAHCGRCGTQSAITGPVTRVIASDDQETTS